MNRRRSFRWLPVALGFCGLVASEADAQTGVRPPRGWSFGVFAGGSAFTDFQRGTVRATRVGSAGEIEFRDFPRSVGAQTAVIAGGILAYWPNKNWGVRAQASYAPSRFETVIPQSDAQFMGMPRSSEDSARLAPLTISMYQAQLLFRLPTIRNRVMPYGIVGGGQTRYTIGSGDPVPEEAVEDFGSGSRNRLAATVGLGAMINMRRKGWGLHFELTNQISQTPIKGASETSEIAENARLLEDPRRSPVGHINTVSFMVGVSRLL